MATFSSLHHFHLSNSSSPSSTTIDSNMCALLDETKNANFLSQFCQLHEKTLDHSTNISHPYNYTNDDDNDNNGTMISSSIVTDHKCEVTQKINANKRKSKEPSSANCAQSKDKREVRRNKQKKMKDGEENNKSNKEEAPKGYIHVRARRGQATDSHSLAERVRREKIGERMKLLQALVPGCDKVTGKALILDVIINYVQSLQNQVEFLSMKLASVNPMFYDLGMNLESFLVRDDENLSDLPHEYSPRAANNYPLIENSANSILFQQDQSPNVFPQDNRQVLWEVDEQSQRTINQSGFNNNNMFLFN